MTSVRRGWLAATLVLVSASACRTGTRPTALEGARASVANLIAADNAGDLNAIAASYAVDAVLLPPGGAEPVRGRAEIAESYAEGLARFVLSVTLYESETRASGDVAFQHGTTRGEYVWRDGSPPTPFADRYLMALERGGDGRWLVAALMWNAGE